MNRVLKISPFFVLIILFSTAAVSQTLRLGGAIALGFEQNAGLNIRSAYIQDQKQYMLDVIFYMPKVEEENFFRVETKRSEINANWQYLFSLQDKIEIYPLVGINITFIEKTYSLSTTSSPSFNSIEGEEEIGINLGGGVNYFLDEKILVFGEFRYLFHDFPQPIINVGACYILNF